MKKFFLALVVLGLVGCSSGPPPITTITVHKVVESTSSDESAKVYATDGRVLKLWHSDPVVVALFKKQEGKTICVRQMEYGFSEYNYIIRLCTPQETHATSQYDY